MLNMSLPDTPGGLAVEDPCGGLVVEAGTAVFPKLSDKATVSMIILGN